MRATPTTIILKDLKMIKITPKFNPNIKFAGNSKSDEAPKAPDQIVKEAPSAPITGETILAQLPNVTLPCKEKNYCTFDEKKVNAYVQQREKAIPELKNILQTSKDEKQIVETLYILDRMIDSGVKGIDKLYPVLSKFNDTDSPNIQVFLAGIYRKTQVPDAFGPLVKMLVKDSQKSAGKTVQKEAKGASNCPNCVPFDPTEEVGGAILEYIKYYSNMKQKPEQK